MEINILGVGGGCCAPFTVSSPIKDSASPARLSSSSFLPLRSAGEGGKLQRVSSAAGPPRLSAGPAVTPELAVRSRPLSVAQLFIFQASSSSGKVASPSFLKSSPSLGGGRWELEACESAVDPRSSGGLSPVLPRAARLDAAASAGRIAGAERREGKTAARGRPDFPQDPKGLFWGAKLPFFWLFPPSSQKPRCLRESTRWRGSAECSSHP
ncbi:hypothetical protein H8959_002700 [Pygathrix nigripes]